MRPNLAHTATISRSTESHQPAEETQRWQRRRRAAASEARARARRAAVAPSVAPSARRRRRAARRRAARARVRPRRAPRRRRRREGAWRRSRRCARAIKRAAAKRGGAKKASVAKKSIGEALERTPQVVPPLARVKRVASGVVEQAQSAVSSRRRRGEGAGREHRGARLGLTAPHRAPRRRRQSAWRARKSSTMAATASRQ